MGIANKDGIGAAAGATDDDLQFRQDGKLYPVGQALRRTYDADNHATLSQDVTGLMLDLARVPFEPHEFEPPFAPPRPVPRPGLFARVRRALHRGREG